MLNNNRAKISVVSSILGFAAAVAGIAILGVALFDRNRSINNGIVIAAGIIFAISSFSQLCRVGSKIKDAVVNAHKSSYLSM
ncbi:hypothetical protein [Candidatus Mesenet endosymbiont of Phosphuga atrata]|uniref:hypothetical protein n=1 Tax=Candidatus Mesenet endosymbiont of Phosphuga atrata TaxID=3066221 RepID=UPI0030D43952